MKDITIDDLTEVQKNAVRNWEIVNDPDGDQYEYRDNYRYARSDNQAEIDRYHELRQHGCCGSEDVELVCSDGSRILYGFNYGH